MKRFKPLIFITAFLVLFSMSGIANAITLAERDELNNATPGTQKVGLGTIIRSVVAEGVYFMTTDDTGVSFEIPVSVEPSGDTGYVRTFTGSSIGKSTTLPDGKDGQIIVLSLTSDGGTDWAVTPDTASGFKSILFSDAGDNASLQFKNTTIGWVVLGTSDVTSGPVLTTPDGTSIPGFK